ncbi:hypothetical protein CGMCC3_g3816 [Colletotrichum fructicola]|nr:uncharacterized protein CGMCC3_g3816 [Colletotrichum fructicola]KAE9579980.1 hypothetical protein CGMCC3_g3816 [Colletotrichum fructicola]
MSGNAPPQYQMLLLVEFAQDLSGHHFKWRHSSVCWYVDGSIVLSQSLEGLRLLTCPFSSVEILKVAPIENREPRK